MEPDPEAVDLDASYDVDQTFPTFGPLSPGGQPYELGISISASAFNQLLKAETESGLLLSTIQEFDLGAGLAPITAGLLAAIFPQFSFLDPSEPLEFVVRPTLAPIFSAGVLSAVQAQVEPSAVTALCTLWLLSRSLYCVFYAFGIHDVIAFLRTFAFLICLAVQAQLFFLAAAKLA